MSEKIEEEITKVIKEFNKEKIAMSKKVGMNLFNFQAHRFWLEISTGIPRSL
jgi:hypothetical protein